MPFDGTPVEQQAEAKPSARKRPDLITFFGGVISAAAAIGAFLAFDQIEHRQAPPPPNISFSGSSDTLVVSHGGSFVSYVSTGIPRWGTPYGIVIDTTGAIEVISPRETLPKGAVVVGSFDEHGVFLPGDPVGPKITYHQVEDVYYDAAGGVISRSSAVHAYNPYYCHPGYESNNPGPTPAGRVPNT